MELWKRILKSNGYHGGITGIIPTEGNDRYITCRDGKYYMGDSWQEFKIPYKKFVDKFKNEVMPYYREHYKDVYDKIKEVEELACEYRISKFEISRNKMSSPNIISDNFELNDDNISVECSDCGSYDELYLPESIMNDIRNYVKDAESKALDNRKEKLDKIVSTVKTYGLEWYYE